jgi:hypothetical protein
MDRVREALDFRVHWGTTMALAIA